MAYDPRTGITTYDDPNAQASTMDVAPAPSTATGMLPYSGVGYIQSGDGLNQIMQRFGSTPGGFYDESGGYVESQQLPYATLSGTQLGLDNNYKYAVYPDGSVEYLYNSMSDGGFGPGEWIDGNWAPASQSTYSTSRDLLSQGVNPTGVDEHGYPTYDKYNSVKDLKSNDVFEPWYPIWQMFVAAMIGAGAGGAFSGAAGAGEGVATGASYGGAGDFATTAGTGTTAGGTGAYAGGATGSAIGNAAVGGATSGSAVGFDKTGTLGGALKGAAAGGAGGAAGSGFSDYASGMLGSTGGAAAGSFLSSLVKSGGKLDQATMAALMGGGADVAAPYVNAAFDQFGRGVGAFSDTPTPDTGDTLKRTLLASGDGPVMDVTPGLFGTDMSPMTADLLGIPRASQVPGALAGDATGVTSDPLTGEVTGSAVPVDSQFSLSPNTLQTIGTIGAQKALDAESTGMLPSEPTAPVSPAETSKEAIKARDLERIANIGAALAKMHEGQGTPEGAPQRQENQSDAEYVDQLVQYANLDAQALADQGLTPGSPEYYQYIMDQMDSIIAQLTDGLDVNGKDLSDELRLKTREEIDQLGRAIYVRGQMGTLMGSGKYTDPFTGIGEDVIAPEGQRVQPSVAAYHRGLARSADELARLHPGQDAKRFLGGLLGRNVDLFGGQANADEQALMEQYASQGVDYDPKRRRGMIPGFAK